jgi:Family of unknown function (DUF6049)
MNRWRRHRRPAATALAALAAVLVCGAVAFGSVARAQPADAAPTQAGPAIQLVDQTDWLHAGDRFQVSTRVTAAPAGAGLQLVVHERLINRNDFRATLEGELGGIEQTLDPQPLAALTSGNGTYATGFVVGGDGERLAGRGVYPVEVRLVDQQGNVLGTPLVAYLAYLPDPEDTSYSPVAVAAVVEVAGPPSLRPDGRVQVANATRTRARERTALLAAADGVPLTVAPLPETLDGLASSDRAAAQILEALASAAGTRPVLTRPYTDVDLAALRQSDLVTEADDQVEAGAAAVSSRFTGEAVPVWWSGPTLGTAAAQQAVDLGFRHALVPPSAVEVSADGEAGAVPDAPVALSDGGPRAMVIDPELSAHLLAGNGPIDAHRFLAELASMWFERPAIPRAVVVTVPGDAEIDPDVIARTLRGLTHGQAVQAVPLDRVYDVPSDPDGPATADLVSHDVTDDLDGIAGPLRNARRDVDGIADTLNADRDGLARSLLLATGSATPDGERVAYVDRVTSEAGSLTDAIDLPDVFRITLTSRTSTIPVSITNRLDRPLTVRIEFDSAQLDFLDGDVVTQELAPGVTRMEVRVRILTSGAFPMGITATSPDQTIVLDRTTFDVRSTAVTGVGLVLSVGAGLFLAVWWGRHWRKARRSRHLVPTGPAPSPPADAPGGTDGAGEGEGTGEYRPAHMAAGRARRP